MTHRDVPGELSPDEHWNREQVERDTAGADATDTDDVWNRQQMEFDNTGTEREGTGREAQAGDLAATDAGSADMEHISGRGMPSGESHWDRVEPDKD